MTTSNAFHGLSGPSLGFVLDSPIHAAVLVQSSGLVEAASPAAIADLGLAPDQIVARSSDAVLGIDLDGIIAASKSHGALHQADTVRFRVHPVEGRNETTAYLVELLAAPSEDVGEVLVSRAERLESIVADLSDRFAELNRFVGVISHDLQAPLRRLLSYAELLRDDLDAPSPDVLSSIGEIERGADHMLRLTTELLAYARLGRGSMPLSSVDGDAALAETLTLLEDTIEAAGGVVTVTGSIGPVAATRTFLMLVFQNLIENALKYRDQTRPLEVSIRAERSDDIVTVDVRDNGIGIPAGQIDTIFDPFRQLRIGGDISNAFGLATVERILERFGGDIAISETTPGVGTVFTVRLHVAPAPSDPPDLAV